MSEVRSVHRRKFHPGFLTAVAAVFILLGIICSFTSRADEGTGTTAASVPKYYCSVQIEDGDTLESISASYNNLGIEESCYIDRLKEINSLCSDRIHPGCWLTVVYTR